MLNARAGAKRRMPVLSIPALILLTVLTAACQDGAQNDAEVPGPANQTAVPDDRPNILLIVADDLGYSDLGFLGGEISTPTLDELASRSIVLTNFYAAPVCTPTRAQLMTGASNDLAWGVVDGAPRLLPDATTMAEVLRDSGYETIMAGKWDLGWGRGMTPHDRGFDRSFAMLAGAADHFNKLHAGTAQAGMAVLNEDGREVEPDDYFSTRTITDKLIEYLESRSNTDHPYFAFASYTAPHWPLQADSALIDRYIPVYDAGYAAIAGGRDARIRRSTIYPAAVAREPYVPDLPDWQSLGTDERREQARLMATYAAMVTELDAQIGRLLDFLRDSGQHENTVVIFISDNGAEGIAQARIPMMVADPASIDNSIGNIGLRNSYVTYGPRWASVSSIPYRGVKDQTLEGGIKVPALISWPARIPGARATHALAGIRDLVSTVYDLAGVNSAALQQLSPAPEGLSLVPIIDGAGSVRTDREYLGLVNVNRYSGSAAATVIMGGHKLVGSRGRGEPFAWELYDLDRDPREMENLIETEPDTAAEMLGAWNDYARRTGLSAATGESAGAAPAR